MNLIRNLLGIMICLLMVNICFLAYDYVADIKFDYNIINDEIAISQLRRIMLISYDVNYSTSALRFRYKNKDFSLSMVNSKLLLQPGTQIFLNEIDDLYFENRNGAFVLIYSRKGKEYEKVLCPSRGIYIDDFSYCDVFSDGDNTGED